MREIRKYVAWKTRQVLEESGADRELASLPFSEFPKVDLAKLVGDVMEDEGYAEWVRGRLRWIRQPGPPPSIETRFFAELKPAVDKALETLPEALLKGVRPLAQPTMREEALKICGGIMSSRLQEWIYQLAVVWAGLDKLPPDTVVVDVSTLRGFVAVALLRLTSCKVIFVAPFRFSLQEAEELAEVRGVRDRLETRLGRYEELHKAVSGADLVVALWTLHRVIDPVVTLRSMRDTAPAALLAQPLQDDKIFRALNLVEYLLGFELFPTYGQLREWISMAGWRVIRQTKSPLYMCVLEAAQGAKRLASPLRTEGFAWLGGEHEAYAPVARRTG